MEQVYARADRELASLHKDPRVSCKRGCNACCRMHTIISMPEAVMIVNTYPRLVQNRLAVLEEHARTIERICATYDNQTLDKEREIADDWWMLQLQCPFVMKDGNCGVYSVRPAPCRTHFSEDDPELCKKVPAVKMAHAIPTQTRSWIDGAMLQIWFKVMPKTHFYAIGSLPKMVLAAYRKANP